MNSPIRPQGILALLYRAPIGLDDRLTLMEAVSRLTTEDRLALEQQVLGQEEKIFGALTEALATKNAVAENDSDALWEKLLVAVMRGKIAEGSVREEDVRKMRPETPQEHRKHKDEQKARILQGLSRSSGMPDQHSWRAVTLVVDRGHKALDVHALAHASREEIAQKETWLIDAFRYLMHDQSHLLMDIIHVLEEELAGDEENILRVFIKELGIVLEEMRGVLLALEKEIEKRATQDSDALPLRLQQYNLLNALQRHDAHARFTHLTHAFIESLKVLFDAAGAVAIAVAERERAAAEEVYHSALAASQDVLPQGMAYPLEIKGLQQLYLSMDEWRAMQVAADSTNILDFDAWDTLCDGMAKTCTHIADGMDGSEEGSNVLPLAVVTARVNAAFKELLNTTRGEALATSAPLIARVANAGDLFRDAVSAAVVRKGRGYFVSVDDLRALADGRDDASARWRDTVRAQAIRTEETIGNALDDAVFQEHEATMAGVLETLMEHAGFAASMEEGWEGGLAAALAPCRTVVVESSAVSKDVRAQVVALDRAYRMKPLARILEEVDERWGSDYPFVAFPLAERREKSQQIASVYHLLVSSLMERNVSVPIGELGKESVERLKDIVRGVDALALMVPRLAQHIKDYEYTEKILENQEHFIRIEDLTKEVFLAYSQKNFELLKKLALAGDIDLEQAHALADVIIADRETEQGAASSFITALSGAV